MKTCLLVLGMLAVAGGFATRAEARDYPWCAYYSGSDGAKNCGFDSFQQCLQDVSGRGGFCQRNPYLAQSPRSSHQGY